MIKGKKIILGITASIAAYKSATTVRLLRKEGAEVKVIMTPMAMEFISPVTLSTLSGNPVLTDFFSGSDGTWNSHVELGTWADLMIIAPLTACTMGKMVNGIADNLLLATYLSARCPVILAPAMDLDMFNHPSTQRNLSILKQDGNIIIEPVTGELASGLHGKGRMEEPEMIVRFIKDLLEEQQNKVLKKKDRLTGKKILVTAGPTHEKIDPVRFIGNLSSGKMGYTIAESLAEKGAQVLIVSGPVNITTSHPNIKIIHVISAREMYDESARIFPDCDAAILSAAVSDYTPVVQSNKKLKRKEEKLHIELKPTIDIAAALGKMKKENQVLVGFALESENETWNATKKIKNKNLDFIVLNSLRDKGAGFGTDTNKVTFIDRDNNIQEFELKQKKEVAEDIIDKLLKYLENKGNE